MARVTISPMVYRKKNQKSYKYGLYIHTSLGNTFILLDNKLRIMKNAELDSMLPLTEEKGKMIVKL